MRLHVISAVSMLAVVLPACAHAQEAPPSVGADHPRPSSPMADPPRPMAPFARLVGGEWKVTFASGDTGSHAWQWGPGKYSMRQMTNASNTLNVGANPWAGEVVYWHPGRQQVRLLSLHGDIPSVGRGVTEGAITSDGQTTEGVFDLHQPRGPRRIGTRRTFDGPDRYREDLLEDTGAGLQPLNSWEFVRVAAPADVSGPVSAALSTDLPARLKPFAALLGHTWEARGELQVSSNSSSAFHVQSSFEWIPSLEVLCTRVNALSGDGDVTHPPVNLLDIYLHHHLGTDAMRCLALSRCGAVYEGEFTVLEGGAVQFTLTGWENVRGGPDLPPRPLRVRLDFEAEGSVRQRLWSTSEAEPTLMLDGRHRKVSRPKE